MVKFAYGGADGGRPTRILGQRQLMPNSQRKPQNARLPLCTQLCIRLVYSGQGPDCLPAGKVYLSCRCDRLRRQKVNCPLSLPIYDRVDIAVRIPEPGDPRAAHHVDIAFLAGAGDIVALESDAFVAKRLHRGIHLGPCRPGHRCRTVRARIGRLVDEQEEAPAW